jgi:hypothetical protein
MIGAATGPRAEAHGHGDRAKTQNADGKIPLQCHFHGKPPLVTAGPNTRARR